MHLENLRELLKHPGWQEYLDLLESDYVLPCMTELFVLEPTKPDNFVKFVQLKTRMDTIRDITYLLEIQVVEPENKDRSVESYTQRFKGLLKKLWRNE